MYPNRNIFTCPGMRNSSTLSNRHGKREQIARMLINKFRQKFDVDFDKDNRLDGKLVDAVNSAVKTDEPLGEKQLVMLSRKLTAMVEDYRRKQR